MSKKYGDDGLAAFRAEMHRRGVYGRSEPEFRSRPEVVGEAPTPVAAQPGTADTVWVFRATGRPAVVLRVTIGRDVDHVSFRFIGESGTRRVPTRKFLEDFARRVAPLTLGDVLDGVCGGTE